MKSVKIISLLLCAMAAPAAVAQSVQWPESSVETKAGSRWWWMGSAVDKENIKWNLEQYAKAGIGTMEVTPIYGVQGNEANEINYLSDNWMQMLQYTQDVAAANNMQIDMNNGTGWPFGGPTVPITEAAGKLVTVTDVVTGDGSTTVTFNVGSEGVLSKVMAYPQEGNENPVTELTYLVSGNELKWIAPAGKWRLISIRNGYTKQMVKRAAPGGEGYVMDHFNPKAVENYLARFDSAFARTGVQFPKTVFNDSYEVYYADWTPVMFSEFEKYRGYKLEENMDKLLGYATDTDNKVLADYRQTLQDMLLNNFTKPWTEWAHKHGAITRNQAHGSPACLLDLYAAVDIPEIEGFGLTDFNIKGLRKDPGFVRDNYSDFTTLKWASSAAHVTGKKLTSSETFTWLTEHFRTSLSQMKPDLDLMFCAGVNRVFFHGTTYGPKSAEWPGWKFYAAIDMSPTNSIWRDAPELMNYIDRCQSFLQMGQPDNDLLVYAPFVNAMHKNSGSLFSDKLLTFPIDNINSKLTGFQTTVNAVNTAGYDCDYISDAQIMEMVYENGKLKTAAGQEYSGLVIPVETYMPEATKSRLDSLKNLGAQIVSGTTASVVEQISGAKKEDARADLGMRLIRRKNDTGYHYFIANLTNKDVEAWTKLGVDFATAVLYNPMDGSICDAKTDAGKVLLSLRSGESIIVQTYDSPVHADTVWQQTYTVTGNPIKNGWKLSFTDSYPAVTETFNIDTLTSWEKINDQTAQLMGTGVYEVTVNVDEQTMQLASAGFNVDLGDVRESARLYVNGEYEGTAWAAPFVIHTNNIHEGDNTIRIEVTNLPANRIRQMDADGKVWRIFEDVNILDVTSEGVGKSGVTSYADWELMPSGLNGSVMLVPVRNAELTELKAELSHMQKDASGENLYYPVYRLSITDGTKIDGDSMLVVTENFGKYTTVSVKGADGETYEGLVPAYGPYTMTDNYDFTAAEPSVGINKLSTMAMGGFSDKVSGASSKQSGKELSFYDGLLFTSSLYNIVYYYPGYGLQSMREMEGIVDNSAYDIAVLSYFKGDAASPVAFSSENVVYDTKTSNADGQMTFTFNAKADGYLYGSLQKFAPVSLPTGIEAVRAEAMTDGGNVYNLQGQKVGSSYKGIVVRNGKKYVVR